MLLERRQRRLYSSHHQFYIEDKGQPGDTGDLYFWTEETVNDCLATVPGTVGIGTGSYGNVQVYTELYGAEPPLNLEEWDCVVEAELEVKIGPLQVIGCLDPSGDEFTVTPGQYRVRCCQANLAESEEVGEGNDWYEVQIWPGVGPERRILKRWDGTG